MIKLELREGIVLKTIKYQESSKILYILTEKGLISALSKNCLNLKSKNHLYSKYSPLYSIYPSKNNFILPQKYKNFKKKSTI